MKGYSSFRNWNSLEEIKESEVEERDNEWFDDSDLDLAHYEGKWVCHEAKYALWYVVEGALFGLDPDLDEKPEDVDDATWKEFKKMWANASDYVETIDLVNSKLVHEDPDNGFLYIRKKEK